MQASVQTERRRKPNQDKSGLHQQSQVQPLPEVDEENERDKQRRLKKLALVNRELIETLKRQNQELTHKINRQHRKGVRSGSLGGVGEVKVKEGDKRQLANAYKQIEMYKGVLQGLRAKEISTESAEKLSQLENRIHMQDGTIEQLQKELRYLRNIKQQQEKELNIFQNEDVRASVSQLEEELKRLKEQLKVAKKETRQREELEKRQHAYYLELDRTLRIHNDEYYPGRTERPRNGQKKQEEEITEREWQVVKTELLDLKKTHEENNRRIEQLHRLRNKEVKSCEQNQIKLKDKLRKLQAVKSKVTELAKLVTVKEESYKEEDEEKHEGEFEEVMKNGKKVFRPKNPEDERGVKRWVIPQGYCQERGKILPDSVFFTDKPSLRQIKKSRIRSVRVWLNSSGVPCLLQCFYIGDKEVKIQGVQVLPANMMGVLQQRLIQFKDGDYLQRIRGRFQDGLLKSLVLESKFGRHQSFNEGSMGEQFKIEGRPNEVPSCIFGAFVRNEQDEIRICHLGCEFIPDW